MAIRGETIGRVTGGARQGGAGWEVTAAGLVRGLLLLAVPVLVLQVFDRALPAADTGALVSLAVAAALALAVLAGLDVAARELAGGDRGPGVLNLAALPVLLAALLYLAGMMAGLALILCLLAALAAFLCHRAGDVDVDGGEGQSLAAAVLDAVWTIKALGAENLVLRRLEQEAAGRRRRNQDAQGPLAARDQVGALTDRAAVLSAVTMGTVLVVNGLMTPGQLAAGVILVAMAARAAFRGTAAWTLDRADAAPVDAGEDEDGADDRPPLSVISGNLMFNRVTFEAPADGLRPVARLYFDRIRVTIDLGEFVVLTGGDAQMQTAMLRLMAGLETPDSGRVMIDGHDLAEYRADSLRRQVAYVPPLGQVMPGTVLENLTGFDTGRNADAQGAARLTGLDAKAASLTDGLDTRLVPGAAGFPAGFLQHLAVTRALAFKPKILLLDRATENLDSQDLRRFATLLERLKGRVTVVAATTQTGLRSLADREIDLDDLKPAPEIGAPAGPDEDDPDIFGDAGDSTDEAGPSDEGAQAGRDGKRA